MAKVIRKLYLFLFLGICLSTNLKAQEETLSGLKIIWFGTTCIKISDGQTSLFFDPYLTRPSLFSILTLQSFQSDPKIVRKWLGEDNKIKGVFVSHTHFDHTLDLMEVARQTGAKIYGSDSVRNITIGAGYPQSSFTKIVNKDEIKIGKFSVKVMSAKHTPHIFDFILRDGKIESPLPSSSAIYKYKMGENFSFLISHPNGNILFHPSALPTKLDNITKVDLVIQGIANRKSTNDLIDKIFKKWNPKVIIPVHHDNMLSPISEGQSRLPFVDLEEFFQTIKFKIPNVKVIAPKYGKVYRIN